MTHNFSQPLRRLLAFSGLLALTVLAPARLYAQGDAPTPNYVIEPSTTLMSGSDFKLYVTTKPSSTFDLAKVSISVSPQSGISLDQSDTANDKHTLIIKGTVGENAQPGRAVLQIKEDGKMGAVLMLDITRGIPIPPQPIPQTPPPDIAWKVLTDGESRAAFGHYVSNKYYCIEATITNRSGYDYQVENIEFKPSSTFPALPATTLGMARATLERGHLIGWRNTSLGFIKAFGPILTGFTPFFKVQNHQLSFSRSINIFSDPFEKGFEAVIPDTTIPELQRLNDQIMSDGFIIRNGGKPITKYVLFPKGFFSSTSRLSPEDVMKKLGEINVSANPIVFLNSTSLRSTLSNSTNSSR